MSTKKISPIVILNLALFAVFFCCYFAIVYCYPLPHVSWDSDYYIRAAFTTDYAIRPAGYGVFLKLLYNFNHTLGFIVVIQFILHYSSSMLLMYIVNRGVKLSNVLYFIFGLALLCEPVAIYYCNSVLSDILFASLTVGAIAFLILYINTKNYIWFVIHTILIFVCIEVRHIGLFYPFFSCFILLLFTPRSWLLVANILILIVVYVGLNKWHTSYNKKRFGAAIYSPFSGWTHANNTLFTLKLANININDIQDPDVKSMHGFITHSLDSTQVYIPVIGGEYLWDPKSPLNIMRDKMIDSMLPTHSYDSAWYKSWYVLAPRYGKWGLYVQSHHPYAYLNGFIIPNIHSAFHPENGEMMNYHIPGVKDSLVYKTYGKFGDDFTARKNVYSHRLLPVINTRYTVLLFTFMAAGLLLIFRTRKFTPEAKKTTWIIFLFILAYYGLTLYSSNFNNRYLLTVFPMMMALIVMIIAHFINNPHVGKNMTEQKQ